LFDYPLRYLLFYVQLKNFSLYGNVIVADEGLQTLSLCCTVMTFEQERIFIVPHLL
jgi:hypothetical protein